jgi:hypothetical protein
MSSLPWHRLLACVSLLVGALLAAPARLPSRALFLFVILSAAKDLASAFRFDFSECGALFASRRQLRDGSTSLSPIALEVFDDITPPRC